MEGASLGLSEKVIEKLFQEAANDKNVIESRKWVEVNYPSDDLDTYRPSDVITSVYLEFREIVCKMSISSFIVLTPCLTSVSQAKVGSKSPR